MAADLTGLTAQVKAIPDAKGAAVQLIKGLATQVDGIKNDPNALAALTAEMRSHADAMAAAVCKPS